MKIIDFEKKGNVVRFYLGNDDVEDWYGDDWDDHPYEHNAGRVYDQFIAGVKDIAFPFECTVLEPQDDWRNNGNSPWCKDDMVDRRVPCIVVVPDDEYGSSSDEFSCYACAADIEKYYFGDKMEADE